MTFQKIFLTFGGAGLSPKYPATVSSLAALFVGVAILYYLGIETLFMLAIAVIVIGIFEINKYAKITGSHKQQEIVIDKTAGVWLALMLATSTAQSMPYENAQILAIIFSFATFRLFDTWKPSTIGWINREVKGGAGVMLDDVLSGIAAGLLSGLFLVTLEKVL
ncbi:Phosphatidylglycerophosphatase A [hydrothermal vent metagenome]|uniref:Phosphatidylglycerophosphatase A n=1 Tax=hydrothermal vent metagenome TaxID=652676 RepID=A0A1W1EC62_9ZZZZ